MMKKRDVTVHTMHGDAGHRDRKRELADDIWSRGTAGHPPESCVDASWVHPLGPVWTNPTPAPMTAIDRVAQLSFGSVSLYVVGHAYCPAFATLQNTREAGKP